MVAVQQYADHACLTQQYVQRSPRNSGDGSSSDGSGDDGGGIVGFNAYAIPSYLSVYLSLSTLDGKKRRQKS